jgi:hypothetical protein
VGGFADKSGIDSNWDYQRDYRLLHSKPKCPVFLKVRDQDKYEYKDLTIRNGRIVDDLGLFYDDREFCSRCIE